MTEQRLALGQWGEDLASRHLKRQGLRILETNLRTPVGEIDILAREGRDLVFVEVKTRRSTAYGEPAEAVGARKQRQILRTAQWYLAEKGEKKLQPRFDVVAIVGDPEGDVRIDHFRAAFDALPDC